MKKLERNEMKKCKGGFWPQRTLWRCNVDGNYENVCYSVQPQGPCGYSESCVKIGTCSQQNQFCIY